MGDIPEGLAGTRESWHRVAEHVLAAGQYADTNEIALRPSPGGFSTTQALKSGRWLAISGADLVLSDVSGSRREPLTTLRAAAEAAGVAPGMPASVYVPATPLDLDAPLRISQAAAQFLADWYALGDEALRNFAQASGSDAQRRTEPADPILWPEHFDLGITLAATNYGASPGDEHVAVPYVYVGPQERPLPGGAFWNAAFGAYRTFEEIASATDAVAFFREGAALLRAAGPRT